ncbi:MAG: glycosyltransferase family 2 protein, partial [Alphaproteobacteria bacterium]
MPEVSVIIPAYKAEPFIARAIASLQAQTHTNWEAIIIADDGQDYEKILKENGIADRRIRFATTGRERAGPSAGRNIGMDMVNGSILAHLDADDAYDNDYLAIMVPHVKKHGAAVGKMRFIHEASGKENNELLVLEEDRLLTLLDMIRYNYAYVNIVFDRNRCPVRWPEVLQYGEDIVIWAMLLDHIPGVYFATAARYNYFKRDGSLSHLIESSDT